MKVQILFLLLFLSLTGPLQATNETKDLPQKANFQRFFDDYKNEERWFGTSLKSWLEG